VPTRVIAKKRCRAMVEPPEKGERDTLNPNLSTRLNLPFSDQGLARRAEGGTPDQYADALTRAIALGWLWRHESGTYVKFTPAGAEMFA
jgi:hypothetical protein